MPKTENSCPFQLQNPEIDIALSRGEASI